MKKFLAILALSLPFTQTFANEGMAVYISSWDGGYELVKNPETVNEIKASYYGSLDEGTGYLSVLVDHGPISSTGSCVEIRLTPVIDGAIQYGSYMPKELSYDSFGSCYLVYYDFALLDEGTYKVETFLDDVWNSENHAYIKLVDMSDENIRVESYGGDLTRLYTQNRFNVQHTSVSTSISEGINSCIMQVNDGHDYSHHIVDIDGFAANIYGNGCYAAIPHDIVASAPSQSVKVNIIINGQWTDWAELKVID